MNVSITNDCNRRCEYCFQKDWYLSEKATPHNKTSKEMTLETYRDLLVWFFKSEDKTPQNKIQLLGGEPMLHSNFINFVEESFKWNIPTLTIISNISVDTPFFEEFIKYYGEMQKPVSFLINSDYPDSQKETFIRNYEMLAKSKIPYSISTTMLPDTKEVMKSAKRIFELLHIQRKYRGNIVPPVIRIAPMCPNQDGKDIDKYEFYNFGADLANFLNYVWQDGVTGVGLDCPLNFCELDENAMKAFKGNGVRLETFRCDPFHGGPTDVLVDNSVIWCSSADFIKIDDWHNYENFRACREALCEKWRDYWSHTLMRCDWQHCGKYNPALCQGVCAAKNRFIENQLKRGKRIKISSIV